MDPMWTVGILVGAGLAGVAAVLVRRSGGSSRADRWSSGVRAPQRAVSPAKPKAKKAKRAWTQTEPLIARLLKPFALAFRFGGSAQSKLQELLVHAGIREKGAVEVFLGAKLALAVALPATAVTLTIWWFRAHDRPLDPRSLFLYGAMALVAGLMVPNIWLRRKARQRIKRVRLSLPDALDLMIVCVEAGLALDAALVRLSQEMTESAPELCEELMLLNLEISAGKPREECLRNLALRTGCEEVESLAARINQATKYGTNLGHSLRIHSESLRQKRRQEAEERAAKTTVKLLFPLVFFIFPAIFVVILGPGLIKVLAMLGGDKAEQTTEQIETGE
jgi:tight adherence protein C